MKVIIAGGRDIVLDPPKIDRIVKESGFDVTELVSGTCRGIDTSGEEWALERGIVVKPFPADWSNIKKKDAVVKVNKYGNKYNAKAGFDRNEKMAKYADALILIWDGQSHGSSDMLQRAKEHGLKIFTKNIKDTNEPSHN